MGETGASRNPVTDSTRRESAEAAENQSAATLTGSTSRESAELAESAKRQQTLRQQAQAQPAENQHLSPTVAAEKLSPQPLWLK